MSAHSKGPWRWEFNRQHKSITLVGGRPVFDKTVMQFDRWGMGGATPLFNEAIAGDRYNIMARVCDKPDWVAPFPGRSHHLDWCARVVHPDAQLIEAAPAMALALQLLTLGLARIERSCSGLLVEFCFRGVRYSFDSDWSLLMDHVGWRAAEAAVAQQAGEVV